MLVDCTWKTYFCCLLEVHAQSTDALATQGPSMQEPYVQLLVVMIAREAVHDLILSDDDVLVQMIYCPAKLFGVSAAHY